MPEPIVVDVADLPRVTAPVVAGRYRVEPADFVVEEVFAHPLDDAGEHLWLWIEKIGLTTHQAIERIAGDCGVPVRQIGFAGLKDRHARTCQWLSLPWPIKAEMPTWTVADDLIVHEMRRHGRKLKRGAHTANRFSIRLRDISYRAGADVGETLAGLATRIARQGVPNYFGEQRFGRQGTNVEMARQVFAGKRLPRNKRSIALSAARSFLFNQVLAARVSEGTWARALAGDVFMLAGTHSVFAGHATDETLEALAERVASGDIAPTGPMPGQLGPRAVVPAPPAADHEQTINRTYPDLIDGLVAARVDAERRALILAVDDFQLAQADDDLIVSFGLPAGAFATSVLRELGDFVDAVRVERVSP